MLQEKYKMDAVTEPIYCNKELHASYPSQPNTDSYKRYVSNFINIEVCRNFYMIRIYRIALIRKLFEMRMKLNQDPIYRIIRTKQTSDSIIYSRFSQHIICTIAI